VNRRPLTPEEGAARIHAALRVERRRAIEHAWRTRQLGRVRMLLAAEAASQGRELLHSQLLLHERD
jgi:hypothetical protein